MAAMLWSCHGETWSWSCHDDGMAAIFLGMVVMIHGMLMVWSPCFQVSWKNGTFKFFQIYSWHNPLYGTLKWPWLNLCLQTWESAKLKENYSRLIVIFDHGFQLGLFKRALLVMKYLINFHFLDVRVMWRKKISFCPMILLWTGKKVEMSHFLSLHEKTQVDAPKIIIVHQHWLRNLFFFALSGVDSESM